MTEEIDMGIRVHFAGINGRKLAQHTRGQDVLVSYADLRSAGTWAWIRPLLERGHWRSVILDSGAFTVYAAQMRGKKAATISVEDFARFAVENAHLFDWVANMDDIGGRVEVSNANFDYLERAGLAGSVVPVWHEGESDDQLRTVLAQGRKAGRIAIGMQRPKGQLVPRNVVACLADVVPKIREWAPEIKLHGFGMTRYASADTCPCGGPGWAFDSVDSTTWIAESCAVERSGAAGGRGIEPRQRAIRATLDSYHGVNFIGGSNLGPMHGDTIDIALAMETGGQAKTVAARLTNLERKEEENEEDLSMRPDQRMHGRGVYELARAGEVSPGRPDDRPDAPRLPRPGARAGHRPRDRPG